MVLLFQNPDGGWPKNVGWNSFETLSDAKEGFKKFPKRKSTIDNSATYTQIRELTAAYTKTNNSNYRDAARRGLEFILRDQRPSGGWRGSDVDAITFNDDAMIGVMRLLKEITQEQSKFRWVKPAERERCRQALARALRVVLDCQIVVDGKKTAWCQQHDHKTLKPVKARSYELPSISGGESVKIVRFLMEQERPNAEIVAAVEGAVAWFRRSAINGIRIERFDIDPVKDGNKVIEQDVRVVRDTNAKPVWARFYEVDTNRPFFCNRDGIKVYTLAEVTLERRTGYSWYNDAPARLLEENYPKWRKRIKKGLPAATE
ncbi:MAG: pectate lyase [Verrucomicrobiales bacterium]|nr:pectate lyase [Verrucomicrobiales bacterium]